MFYGKKKKNRKINKPIGIWHNAQSACIPFFRANSFIHSDLIRADGLDNSPREKDDPAGNLSWSLIDEAEDSNKPAACITR